MSVSGVQMAKHIPTMQDLVEHAEALQEEQRLAMREHLTAQQTWDVPQGQTLEERRTDQATLIIQRQIQDNVILREQVQQFPQAQANAVADGAPVQTQAPAQQTLKERRKEAKETRAAQKHCASSDHITYSVVNDIQQHDKKVRNSMTREVVELATREHVDTRMLQSFSYGYNKNRRGAPVTAKDQANKALDERFLSDYISKDPTRREKHLDRITDELLSIQFTPEMLTDKNLKRNGATLRNLGNKIVYFENIYVDKHNTPYFQKLPAYKRGQIDLLFKTSFLRFASALNLTMQAHGVEANMGEYYEEETPIAHAKLFLNGYEAHDGQEACVGEMKRFEICQAEAPQQIAVIAQRQIDQEMVSALEETHANSERMKKEANTREDLKEIAGLNLTADVTGYSFSELNKYRTMMEDNVPRAKEHGELLTKVYQEFYRGMDAMGDLLGQGLAYQTVVDTHSQSRNLVDRKMCNLLLKRLEAHQEKWI